MKLHIEVMNAQKRGVMKVKFIDVRPSPAVNIDRWDPDLAKLESGTIITVVGTLHFGAKSGATDAVRYKVKEISGRIYNDHRHWRTDKAIYVTHPSWTVRPLTRQDIVTQQQRDVLAEAEAEAEKESSPAKKKEIMEAAEKKVDEMMVGGQMTLLKKFEIEK